MGARYSRSQIAWFERPSAIKREDLALALGQVIKRARASGAGPRSWATTSGSMTEPAAGDPPDRVRELVEVVDAVLEQVADAARASSDTRRKANVVSTYCDSASTPTAVPCS